jgi:hypothetical protein
MSSGPPLEDAILLAAESHRDQKAKVGDPYVLHGLLSHPRQSELVMVNAFPLVNFHDDRRVAPANPLGSSELVGNEALQAVHVVCENIN